MSSLHMPIGASLYCWHTSFGAMFRYMLHKNLSGQNIATCYDKWFIWTKFIWAKAFMFWILMFILQCITKIIEPSKFEFFLLYSRHEKLICKAFNSPPKLWSSLVKKEIWKLFEVHQAFWVLFLGHKPWLWVQSAVCHGWGLQPFWNHSPSFLL